MKPQETSGSCGSRAPSQGLWHWNSMKCSFQDLNRPIFVSQGTTFHHSNQLLLCWQAIPGILKRLNPLKNHQGSLLLKPALKHPTMNHGHRCHSWVPPVAIARQIFLHPRSFKVWEDLGSQRFSNTVCSSKNQDKYVSFCISSIIISV